MVRSIWLDGLDCRRSGTAVAEAENERPGNGEKHETSIEPPWPTSWKKLAWTLASCRSGEAFDQRRGSVKSVRSITTDLQDQLAHLDAHGVLHER